MDLSRLRNQAPQRYRGSLDRRVDQLLETGRQFVDGVAGNRPGKRRIGNSGRLEGSRLQTVGRWVGDKLEWLLEDEDDWLEPWQSESQPTVPSSSSKRPLGAISLRAPRAIPPASKGDGEPSVDDQWPEESSFRVERWKRSSGVQNINSETNTFANRRETNRSQRRPLPRSSRRRN